MKPITIVAIIAAVVVVGGACVGIPLSGVLNGGTTGPGGDDPVQPTETPVEPTPTETPTETPTPTPTSMSYFSGGGSKSDSGSSEPEPEPECTHDEWEYVSASEGKHKKICKSCGYSQEVVCTLDSEYTRHQTADKHYKECVYCGQKIGEENCFSAEFYLSDPITCVCGRTTTSTASIGTASEISYYPTVRSAFLAAKGTDKVVNLTRDMTSIENIESGLVAVLNTTGKVIHLNYTNTEDIKIQKYGWSTIKDYSHVYAVVNGQSNTEVTDNLVEPENSDLLVLDLSTDNPPSTERKTVATAAELRTILQDVADEGSGNSVVYITSDITFEEGDTWSSITVDGYNGADVIIINGNGHTITGLSAPLFAGGFAGGSGIIINDLTIADSTIVSTNTQGSGAFIECVDSMDVITLKNCHLKDSTVTGSRTGGLIGWTSGYSNTNDGAVKTYVTIEGCSVIGCTIKNTIADNENTPNDADDYIDVSANPTESLGAINGHAGANAWTFTTIKNCVVKENTLIGGSGKTGVILGTANAGAVTITGCTVSGNTVNGVASDAVYGRFVPNDTGKLTIDGVEIK